MAERGTVKALRTSAPADIEMWPIARLVADERNARTHPKKQIEELRQSFRDYGQVWPVLIREDGTLIAGHGRVEAMRLEGMSEVKAIVARGWSDRQCRAFALLDNRVPLNAGWDSAKLAQELLHLRDDGIDLLDIGFSKGDLARLVPEREADTGAKVGGLIFSVVVRCDSEAHQAEVLERLEREGLKCEALIS